jgi:hypothetical protein
MGRIAKWRQAREDEKRRAKAWGKVFGLLFIKHQGKYVLTQQERVAMMEKFLKRLNEGKQSEGEDSPPGTKRDP